MQITKKSILTGNENTLDIDITPEQLEKVNNRRELGLAIQNIVPHLCADDREFLINGITPEESKHFFGEDEYEEEKYVDEVPR